MQFLRQNLFLVIVGVALLVGAGALLAMNYVSSGQIEQNMQTPDSMLQNIRTIRNNGYITDDWIKGAKSRLDSLKDVSRTVATESLKWNRRTYSVLQLRNKVAGKEQVVSAFPIEGQYQNSANLFRVFRQTYQEALDKLLESMSPVKMISDEELGNEVDRQTHQMQLEEDRLKAAREKEENATTKSTNPGLAPVPTPRGGGHFIAPPPDRMGGNAPPWGAGGGAPNPGGDTASADVSARASAKAMNIMMFRQAKRGNMYVAPEALSSAFAKSTHPYASPEDLWRAQINLWVKTDIVSAINATNQRAMEDAKATQGTVLNAAVKKLLRIDVDEQYYVGVIASSSTGGGGASFTGGGFVAPHAVAPAPTYTPGATAGGAVGSFQAGPSFTRHVCTQEYDVLQYRFVVVMPARYIPILETNLMQRNYHTILKVDVNPLTASPQSGSGSAAALADRSTPVPPYYGTDALIEVEFQGELLLLTAWERGTYDSATSKWTLPPLMPKEMVKWLYDQGASNALRPEDLQQIADLIRR